VNNRSNQVTEVDGSAAGISYDANGNMLTVPTGEGLTGPSRKLVWDAWNRLRKVSDENDNVIAEYEYDGKTRRTKVESGGVTRHCYYDDQWRTLEERLDSSTTPVTQHVWHPTDRWELLFRDRSTANNGTLDERLYSLKDQLDPVAICDTSGSVVERFAYSAFGIPTFLDSAFIPQSSSLFGWSYLFHAEFTDAETGWFNYGYRYYVPELGRWLSRDPIGEKGGANLYGMVQNDPVNHLDRLGQEAFILFVGKEGKDVLGFRTAAQTKKREIEKSPKFNPACDSVHIIDVKRFGDMNSPLKRHRDIVQIYYFGHGGPGILFLDMASTKANTNITRDGGWFYPGFNFMPASGSRFASTSLKGLDNSHIKKHSTRWAGEEGVWLYSCYSGSYSSLRGGSFSSIATDMGSHFGLPGHGVMMGCRYPKDSEGNIHPVGGWEQFNENLAKDDGPGIGLP